MTCRLRPTGKRPGKPRPGDYRAPEAECTRGGLSEPRREPRVAVRRVGQDERAPQQRGATAGQQLPPDPAEGRGRRLDEGEGVGLSRAQPRGERRRQRDTVGQVFRHPRAGHRARGAQGGRQRHEGPAFDGEDPEPLGVDGLALEDSPEVQPLHERERETVLEGRVKGELEQEVLGRRPEGELPAPGKTPGPEPLGVAREEAGRRGHAAVQLQHLARGGLAQSPGVVTARDDDEAAPLKEREPVTPSLQGQEVHVGHRSIALDRVDRLGQHGSLQGQRADTGFGQERARPGQELDLREGADQLPSAFGGEGRPQGFGPRRRSLLDCRK